MSTSISTVTAVLEVKDLGTGNYAIKEIASDEADIPDLHSDNRKQINIPIPVPGLDIVAYVDIGDKEIGAYVTLFGTQVGPKYTASIDQGLNISLDLKLVSGSIAIFKQGNELKGKYDVSAGWGPFKTEKKDEFHIMNL